MYLYSRSAEPQIDTEYGKVKAKQHKEKPDKPKKPKNE